MNLTQNQKLVLQTLFRCNRLAGRANSDEVGAFERIVLGHVDADLIDEAIAAGLVMRTDRRRPELPHGKPYLLLTQAGLSRGCDARLDIADHLGICPACGGSGGDGDEHVCCECNGTGETDDAVAASEARIAARAMAPVDSLCLGSGPIADLPRVPVERTRAGRDLLDALFAKAPKPLKSVRDFDDEALMQRLVDAGLVEAVGAWPRVSLSLTIKAFSVAEYALMRGLLHLAPQGRAIGTLVAVNAVAAECTVNGQAVTADELQAAAERLQGAGLVGVMDDAAALTGRGLGVTLSVLMGVKI